MKGADKFYDIISKASNKKLGNLRKLDRTTAWGLGKEVYINGNVLYALNDHARGNCFHIYLIEDNALDDKGLVSQAFEVYGVVKGNRGWTEEYGWLRKGSWVIPILKYLLDLEKEIIKYDEVKSEQKKLKRKEKNKEIEIKVDKFNEMFRGTI